MSCVRNEQIYTLDPSILEKEFRLKPLLEPTFGLLDLDLLETVGTGTFGRVRLVRRISDKKYYALKILKKSRIIRLQQIKHTQNEVKILSHLDCKFVVNLIAFFQDESTLYMMLEYIAGGELYSYLRRKRYFEENDAKFYTVELASALDSMHRIGIAYRDIKPENILIATDGHIRLTDFGFAKVVLDRTFTLCGTPEYLAPEIVKGEGHGRAVDWWALGILLFEMIVGYPPFADDNPFMVYRSILSGKIKFPSKVSMAARTVINGFLTGNRINRLGCGKRGLQSLTKLTFFKGVDWPTVASLQVVPPMLPIIKSEGDTSNFDSYPDEHIDECCILTATQREAFDEFDVIVGRRLG